MLLIITGNFNLSSFTLGKTKKTGQQENKAQKDKGKLWHVPFWKPKKKPWRGHGLHFRLLDSIAGKMCVSMAVVEAGYMVLQGQIGHIIHVKMCFFEPDLESGRRSSPLS